MTNRLSKPIILFVAVHQLPSVQFTPETGYWTMARTYGNQCEYWSLQIQMQSDKYPKKVNELLKFCLNPFWIKKSQVLQVLWHALTWDDTRHQLKKGYNLMMSSLNAYKCHWTLLFQEESLRLFSFTRQICSGKKDVNLMLLKLQTYYTTKLCGFRAASISTLDCKKGARNDP